MRYGRTQDRYIMLTARRGQRDKGESEENMNEMLVKEITNMTKGMSGVGTN